MRPERRAPVDAPGAGTRASPAEASADASRSLRARADFRGYTYPTTPDGARYALPTDPRQATPLTFLENEVLPTLREAQTRGGQPRYPRSVAELERLTERLRAAERAGHTTRWDDAGNSFSRAARAADGTLEGVTSHVNVRLLHEWNAARDNLRHHPFRADHLHESAGRFTEDLTHEFAHRHVHSGVDRLFDPTASREDNVRRMQEYRLQDEASRARNGRRAERVFMEEAHAGYQPQRGPGPFEGAHRDWVAGRGSAGDLQQRVIDEVGSWRPMSQSEGTYRDTYRHAAEHDYDRLLAQHRARPPTAAETERIARMEGDLRRAAEVLPADHGGALRSLEALRDQPHWQGLGEARGPSGIIGASSTEAMWRDMRRFNLPEREMAELGYLYGRDEVAHRVEGGWVRYAGDARGVEAPARWHVDRPPGMPEPVYEAMVRGVNERHAEELLRAHQDAARRIVRPSAELPVRLDLRAPDVEGSYRRLLGVHQQAPLTAAESARVRAMSSDLQRAGALAAHDPEASVRALAELPRQEHWRGLSVERGPRAHLNEPSVRALWAEMQAHPRGPGEAMESLAERFGRDEAAHRYGAHYRGLDGQVRVPGGIAVHGRPADMPQSVYDGLVRGLQAEHADRVLGAYRDAAQGLPRLGARLDVPLDGSAGTGALPPARQPGTPHAPGPSADPGRSAEPGRPRVHGSAAPHASDTAAPAPRAPDPATRAPDPGAPPRAADLPGPLDRRPAAAPHAELGERLRAQGMSEDGVRRLLGQQLQDRPAGEVLEAMIRRLPGESQQALTRVVGSMSPEASADFLRLAQHLDGRELASALGPIDQALSNLRRVAPGMMDDVGRMFGAMNRVVSGLGLDMTARVAGRVLRGVGAMLPAVGTAFAGYEVVRMAQVAADGTLPRELRFLGGVGVALNGADAALGVVEMFGIGNVGLPANLALGAASLGLDLYTHHHIDRFRADPAAWRPSRELNAFVAGSALAMGPTGAAMLVGTFGATGAEEKMLDLGQVGGELAINAARLGGVAAADGLGGAMRFTAQGIDALADMIRRPERFGAALQALGVGAADLGRSAISTLGRAAEQAGALGRRALGALGDAGTWLMDQGRAGLDTLQWMMNEPGAAWRVAQDRVGQLITRGGELGRAALDGLTALGDRGLETARLAVNNLQHAGERGLEMLSHAYRRFRDDPAAAVRALGDAAVDGIRGLAERGGELARGAVRSLIDFVNAQPAMAERALGALRDLARQGGVAIDEIAGAWGRNLSEGGRALLASLENLGGAGVEALGRLAGAGGALAEQGVRSLGRLYDRGVTAAQAGLQAAARALSPENLQRFLLETPARAARAVFDALGGERVAGLVESMSRAPQELRRLYDQLDWRHVRQLVGNVGRETWGALMGSLDGGRLREIFGHFDAGFLARAYDALPSWDEARRWFAEAGPTLQQTLAGAIGSERLGALVNAAGTSVEWIRTHLAGSLRQLQSFGDVLQRTSAAGLRKLRDALGVDHIGATLRQMRASGVRFAQGLVNGAQELGDEALRGAMGLVDQVAPVNDQGYRLLPDGAVPPWDPRAQWWFGLRNPF